MPNVKKKDWKEKTMEMPIDEKQGLKILARIIAREIIKRNEPHVLENDLNDYSALPLGQKDLGYEHEKG